MRPARLLLAASALSALAACSARSDESYEGDGELRSDPNAVVPTTDPSAHLLSGYNALLDRATSSACVAPDGAPMFNVGDVRGEFYLRHISSKEDLAKQLDVDVGASLKLPRASGDASVKLVNSFKRSATTVTFLVRAVRSYTVTNRRALTMTAPAREMLERRAYDEFLRKCGGSYIAGVRYEAEVLGLMQFECQSEEVARSVQTAIGGEGTAVTKNIGSARADLKAKAEQTAVKNNASLTLTVVTAGFLPQTAKTGDVAEHTFEKIDELRGEMNKSFEEDLARDRADYAGNGQRNVKASIVTQGGYAQIKDAPDADYARMTTTLARAEEFFRSVATTQLRMESLYADEIERFLSDPKYRFRYNLTSKPKLRLADLVPVAQSWAEKFRPDGERGAGTLVEPLRAAVERCLTAAGAGTYSACTTDPVLDRAKGEAEDALAQYAAEGRIVWMSSWQPRLNTTHSYRNAEPECQGVLATTGTMMRLPKRSEMPYIAPAVTAMGGPAGEVWFAGDAQCAKPFFKNDAGQGYYGCADTTTEPLPYVGDRPVLCVSLGGPVGPLSRP
jgi:hypothetical protein